MIYMSKYSKTQNYREKKRVGGKNDRTSVEHVDAGNASSQY